MRLHFAKERVLAVVAHPDDAEMLCAGTLARVQADGAPIAVAVLCRGDKGQPSVPVEDLVGVRREEMAAAAALLGGQLFPCGFGDGELFDGVESRRALMEVYRQFQPTLVLAHSPSDYHADHRAAALAAEAATWFAASTGHQTESPALSAPPALWWMDTVNMLGFSPHFYVDISEYVELKRRMLACHRSQLQRGRDADFSPLESLMLRQSEVRGAQASASAAEAFCWHAAWKRTRAW